MADPQKPVVRTDALVRWYLVCVGLMGAKGAAAAAMTSSIPIHWPGLTTATKSPARSNLKLFGTYHSTGISTW